MSWAEIFSSGFESFIVSDCWGSAPVIADWPAAAQRVLSWRWWTLLCFFVEFFSYPASSFPLFLPRFVLSFCLPSRRSLWFSLRRCELSLWFSRQRSELSLWFSSRRFWQSPSFSHLRFPIRP